ncbi:MAG: RNA pyrophosphohydrolase [Pseudomonadota bacterium]|nr:RNA pyrophosphohydrolase [Pseudomonadota bacterium]
MAKDRNNQDLDENGYRRNVGIIICNHEAEVLWARRVRHDGWQFPQGGVEPDEDAREAVFRELYEEIGLLPHQVRLLGSTSSWLHYDVPRHHCCYRRSPNFRGQKQRWFLFRFMGKESDVCLDRCNKPEFDSWCWVDYWHPLHNIVAFKKGVYRQALTELEPLLRTLGNQPELVARQLHPSR